MYELILHIGFPKTGSSFLQKLFFPKSKQINFIRNDSFYSLLALNSEISEKEKVKKLNNYKYKLFKKNKLNVISFEHFVMPANCLRTSNNQIYLNYLEPKEIIDNIKCLGVKVRVLIIIRNQKDWLWSWYQERIKRFETRTFENMILCNDFKSIIKVINYDKTFDLWKSNFDDCEIIPFELLKKQKKLFLKKLCSYLNIKVFNVENKVIKSSLSYFSIRIKRRINFVMIYIFNSTNNNKIIKKLLIKLVKNLFSLDFIFKKLFKTKHHLKIPIHLEKEFSESNNKLCKRTNLTLKEIGYY